MPSYQFDKLFSPDEANALIPTLEYLIRQLQARANELRRQITGLAAEDSNIAQMALPEIIDRYPDLKTPASAMADVAHQIEEHGCFLKDLDLGLIDFPWRIDEQRVVFLCWQFGESNITAWHPVEAGFAQRQPLPGAAKQYLN